MRVTATLVKITTRLRTVLKIAIFFPRARLSAPALRNRHAPEKYLPHRGLTSGTPRNCKGMFPAYTQALRDRDLPEEDIRVLNKIIPDLLFDLRGAGEAFEDMKQMGLSGVTPLGEAK